MVFPISGFSRGLWTAAIAAAVLCRPAAGDLTVFAAEIDQYGDSLDGGASQRLGSSRFRTWGPAAGLAFCPDNRTIVVAPINSQHRLLFLDAESGRQMQAVDLGENRTVSHLQLAHDRRSAVTFEIVSLGPDSYRTLRRWDLEARNVLSEIKLPLDFDVRSLAVSPDGATAASGGDDGVIHVWDMSTGKKAFSRELAGRPGVRALAISGDGALVAVASFPKRIDLWQWRSLAEPRRIRCDGDVTSLAISPNGAIVALGESSAGGLPLHDIASGELKRRLPVTGPSKITIRSVEFSPDGQFVAAASNSFGEETKQQSERRLHVWDVASGQIVRETPCGQASTADVTLSLPIAYSGDGRYLALALANGGVRVTKTPMGEFLDEAVCSHWGPSTNLRLSHDGQKAVTTGVDGSIRTWDVALAKCLQVLRHQRGTVDAVALSGDGRFVASTNDAGSLRIWDCEAGTEVYGSDTLQSSIEPSALAFSADLPRRLNFWRAGILTVVEVGKAGLTSEQDLGPEKPKGQGTRPPLSLRPVCALLSSDGARLGVGDRQKIAVFDVSTGRSVAALWADELRDRNATASISADGKLFGISGLSRAPGRLVRILDMDTQKVASQFALPAGAHSPAPLCFSPDGRVMAVGYWDGSGAIALIDARAGTRVGLIEGLTGQPSSVEFSGSGNRLGCALTDSTSLIFELSLPGQ